MLVCFAHFICNRCPYVVLYPVLFLWDHSIQEQRAPWLHTCVFTNPSLRCVYVGYCGVLDHWVYRRENSNKILLFFSFCLWNLKLLKFKINYWTVEITCRIAVLIKYLPNQKNNSSGHFRLDAEVVQGGMRGMKTHDCALLLTGSMWWV